MKQRLQAVWKRAVDASPIRKVGASLLAVAFVIALIGYLNQHGNLYLGETLNNLLGDFYANTSAELASIAITVLIIDALYQRREINREKRDLILQLGSPDNAFATEALRKIRAREWLQEGALSGAFLYGAKLEGADLESADLSYAELVSANLESADLSGADLSGADLMHADLRYSNLRLADLSGADLSGADLTNATISDTQLAKAKSLSGVIMPDGTLYDGRFDKEDQD